MENPKTELFLQPEKSIIMFGDGYAAMMQPGAKVKEEDGKKILDATILPHSNLRKAYNIRSNELDDNGNITSYKMDKNDLIPLNLYDDSNRVFLYIKNFTDSAKKNVALIGGF